jgi:hypothetical protein
MGETVRQRAAGHVALAHWSRPTNRLSHTTKFARPTFEMQQCRMVTGIGTGGSELLWRAACVMPNDSAGNVRRPSKLCVSRSGSEKKSCSLRVIQPLPARHSATRESRQLDKGFMHCPLTHHVPVPRSDAAEAVQSPRSRIVCFPGILRCVVSLLWLSLPSTASGELGCILWFCQGQVLAQILAMGYHDMVARPSDNILYVWTDVLLRRQRITPEFHVRQGRADACLVESGLLFRSAKAI